MFKRILVSLAIVSTFSLADTTAERDISKFTNIGFGLGIGVEYFGDTYIDKAQIYGDDKIVIIEEDSNIKQSLWLTMSWNFPEKDFAPRLQRSSSNFNVKDIRYGMFTGVKVLDTSGETINAFSLGLQVSFMTDLSKTITLGVGGVSHKIQMLQDGIEVGKELPNHFENIVYKNETSIDPMLMLSVSF
ncbi:MAG: hypothetical protein U9R27_07300 [Campylobacterota bacterium]|nr:hypothetical protein [Campylobacterota bacterium]